MNVRRVIRDIIIAKKMQKVVTDSALQIHRAVFSTSPRTKELLAIAPQIPGGRCAAGIEQRIGVLALAFAIRLTSRQ
jgi:hypothetical protein